MNQITSSKTKKGQRHRELNCCFQNAMEELCKHAEDRQQGTRSKTIIKSTRSTLQKDVNMGALLQICLLLCPYGVKKKKNCRRESGNRRTREENNGPQNPYSFPFPTHLYASLFLSLSACTADKKCIIFQ